MTLTCIGSSSSGNGYILQDENEALILEAGIRLEKTKQALNFNTRKVAGLIMSHDHGDHSIRAKEYERVFPVYANKEVIQKRGLTRATEIRPNVGFMVGNFKVYPFPGAHDVPVLGFLINHPKIGNLLFVTDSFFCEYKFKNLQHILLECNYTDEKIADSVKKGDIPQFVADRTMISHMSLETCKRYLMEQDLENVHDITLIHLSARNADPELMYDTISRATGKPIQIARPGLKFELSNNPF